MEHPTIIALGEAANDLVTWSNVSLCSMESQYQLIAYPDSQDIFSYNVEQSKGTQGLYLSYAL